MYDPQALHALHETIKKKAKAFAVAMASTDTSSWYTRNQSIDMLRVSTQTLKNYERQNKLHPLRALRRDIRGHQQNVVVYDPKELARLPEELYRSHSARRVKSRQPVSKCSSRGKASEKS